MTITAYTDRAIKLQKELALEKQLAQLNGEIAAELKAERDTLRQQLAESQAEVLRLQGSEIGMNRYSAKVNAENKVLREQLAEAQARINSLEELEKQLSDNVTWQAGEIAKHLALIEASRKQEPVAWQYQSRDGTWRAFLNDKHYDDTKADGTWPIRCLYTAPVVAPDVPTEVTEVARVAIENVLREYNYPANTNNAARAGWRACRLHIAAMGGAND